jgi:hypothetical protein
VNEVAATGGPAECPQASGSLRPRVANSVRKPARQLGNSIGLPPPDRLPRNQLSADAKRHGTSGDEVECSPLIYASSSNQWYFWKHCLQVSDITVAPDVPARNNFHKIRAKFPRSNDVGRRQGPRDDDDVLLHGESHGFRIKSVTGQECGSCVQTEASCFPVQNTSRSDSHLRRTLDHVRNDFDRFGHG